MARRKDDDSCRKGTLIDRRGLLKAAGATALALGAGSAVGTAAARPVTGARSVVDLGEEGLSDGDSIDPYFDAHFASNTEVHVPAGEYTYTGAGLGGTYSKAALLGSPEGVVLRRPDDAETPVRPTITAAEGAVRLENLTIAGTRGRTQSRWRVGAAADARVEVVNVNFPDGSVADSESVGLYAGANHAGLLWVTNCYFAGFDNVALDAADPYKGANGPVVVEECDFRDAAATALTLGSDHSVVRGSYFGATADASGQRAIEIAGPGTDMRIADCDIDWARADVAPIHFDATSAGGGGTITDVRVADGAGTGLVSADWPIDSAWSGTNIDVTEV